MLRAFLDSSKLPINQKMVKEQPKSSSSARSAALCRGTSLISDCISLAKGGGEELLGAFRGSTRRRGQVVPHGIIRSNEMNKKTLKADSGEEKSVHQGGVCYGNVFWALSFKTRLYSYTEHAP